MLAIKQNSLTLYNRECSPTLNTMPKEVIVEIVMRCLENVGALANTNCRLCIIIAEQIRSKDISLFCPKLTFVDTTERNSTDIKVPRPNKYRLIEAYHTLAPLVEGDKGVSWLIMFKGSTIAKLGQIAKNKKIELINFDTTLSYTNDVALPETYHLLISNNVTIGSRNQTAKTQFENIQKMGVNPTTCQELFALCVFTNHRQDSPVSYRGTQPLTIGRTSTQIQQNNRDPIVVGNCEQGSITIGYASRNMEFASIGMPACKRL